MNALAPVERNGRLRMIFGNGSPQGFSAGEFAVKEPSDRVRAIGQRSLGESPIDIELRDFLDLNQEQLKRRLKVSVVMQADGRLVTQTNG